MACAVDDIPLDDQDEKRKRRKRDTDGEVGEKVFEGLFDEGAKLLHLPLDPW